MNHTFSLYIFFSIIKRNNCPCIRTALKMQHLAAIFQQSVIDIYDTDTGTSWVRTVRLYGLSGAKLLKLMLQITQLHRIDAASVILHRKCIVIILFFSRDLNRHRLRSKTMLDGIFNQRLEQHRHDHHIADRFIHIYDQRQHIMVTDIFYINIRLQKIQLLAKRVADLLTEIKTILRSQEAAEFQQELLSFRDVTRHKIRHIVQSIEHKMR